MSAAAARTGPHAPLTAVVRAVSAAGLAAKYATRMRTDPVSSKFAGRPCTSSGNRRWMSVGRRGLPRGRQHSPGDDRGERGAGGHHQE
ncbi:hypothetical protein [Thermomonospora umbrina]|uniref:Uncharacterized protein n=1 Tax=Thermomonospora umbrina TaxID=111806 RepID=A0A3D9SYU0_9ACTN|nr:hypothetical protein [Thermomonospora umbrina]REF00748.1 hypothetical protein DFJ69_6327 [Thermomonospora umbrina]